MKMSQTIPVESLKKTIAYFYLLSYCPPEQMTDFKRTTAAMHKALAESAGMQEAAYFSQVLPEVCRRIVAFHQDTREPDAEVVAGLAAAARTAEEDPASLRAFQAEMARVAGLPGRGKPENRLHRNKGCRYCAAACRYGYFTLVSDPQLKQLQDLFAEEASQPASRQTPLRPVYSFAIDHLLSVTGTSEGICEIAHVANLSYCLLMLGMAKSRLVLPEAQLRIFQEANQEFIRRQKA
jgi:hypothetical protein